MLSLYRIGLSPIGRGRQGREILKVFAQLIVVACIGLLSWWQKDFHRQVEAVTGLLILLGVAAAVLAARSHRSGYVLAALLGLGYLAEIARMVDRSNLYYMSPLLGWSAGLFVAASGLLWLTRERPKAKPVYERHPEY